MLNHMEKCSVESAALWIMHRSIYLAGSLPVGALLCGWPRNSGALMAAVQEWREVKLSGKGILKQPQPHYDTFKALFTHGVLGFSRSGRPIWVMKVRAIWSTGIV